MADRIIEHMLVVLTHDEPRHGLKSGDVGCVIMEHGDQEAFEVEFESQGDSDILVLTLDRSKIREKSQDEILHVRATA